MSNDKARVIARAESRVPDYEMQKLGTRRFIGQEFKETAPKVFDWVPTGEVETVLRSREIAIAIADGDLQAADAETASWVLAVTRKEVHVAGAPPKKPASPPKSGEADKEKA